jgi:hypothetical protein
MLSKSPKAPADKCCTSAEKPLGCKYSLTERTKHALKSIGAKESTPKKSKNVAHLLAFLDVIVNDGVTVKQGTVRFHIAPTPGPFMTQI